MQGNGDNYDRPDGHRFFEVGNRFRQHASQHCRRGTNLLKLEHMDQIAQSAGIAAIGDRPLEGRIDPLTKQAPNLATLRLSAIRLFANKVARQVQRRSTNRAVRPLERSQRGQAGFTNGKAGNSE